MKTSPYVAFYPSDFLVGTMCMSAEEVGAYMRLLCFQWQQGGVPQQGEKLARITGLSARKLTLVLAKFDLHEDGLLKNPRMEVERVKVESFRDRQAENGRKGGRPKKPQEGPAQTHAHVPENPRVTSGFTQGEPRQTQSEAEPESKAESEASPPPHPPGGREGGRACESEAEAGKAQALLAGDSTGKAPSSLTTSIELRPGPDPDPASASASAFHSDAHAKPNGKGKGQGQNNAWQPTASQLQISAWFNRKPGTVWSDKEQKVWKTLRIEEEDLEILHWFYTGSGCRYLRQDLWTLLNNWRGEVDRARNFTAEDARR